MKTLLLILLLALPAFAQTPSNDALFGTFNLRDDAARIRWATNSEAIPVSLSTLTFSWTNGPPEEINYKNHTWALGYNVDFNGAKIVPGVVSYNSGHESKYRNGVAGAPGSFMSEHHFFHWNSPDGSIDITPLDGTVQYDTGNFEFSVRGQMSFFRQASNGGGQWATWYDTGHLDLSNALDGALTFKNNSSGIRWRTSSGVNTVAPIRVDDQNRTILGVGGGGSDVYIQSNWMDVNNIQLGSEIALRSQPTTRIQMAGHYTWVYSNGAMVASLSQWQAQFYKPVIADEVRVGTLKLEDNDTLYTVSIGAANSCGTGFRCLRVNN